MDPGLVWWRVFDEVNLPGSKSSFERSDLDESYTEVAGQPMDFLLNLVNCLNVFVKCTIGRLIMETSISENMSPRVDMGSNTRPWKLGLSSSFFSQWFSEIAMSRRFTSCFIAPPLFKGFQYILYADSILDRLQYDMKTMFLCSIV